MEHTESEIDSVISRQNVAKEGWTTYYVDGTDGNDGNNGLRWESAFKTIQAAIDTAESWAKIYVKAGTYTEVITVDKDNIKLIGEKKDTTIIQANDDDVMTVTANHCEISEFTLTIVASVGGHYCLDFVGDYNEVHHINLEGSSMFDYGLIADGDFSKIHNCYSASDIEQVLLNVSASRIYDNIFLSALNNIAIDVIGDDDNRIYNNLIANCLTGIDSSGDYNLYFHNNIINNTTQVTDAGINHWFENYYDDHTIDTNNDGLCDTPYTFVIGTDYSPVSNPDGWLQQSLGMTPSSSIIIANIFSVVNAILMLTETGGTITTDGAVQNLYINETPAGVFEPKIVQIDFTAQTAAETVVIREWYRIKEAPALYIEKDAVTFTGVQSPKLKNINLEPNRFGVKVTIEKTAGANQDYDWSVIYKA